MLESSVKKACLAWLKTLHNSHWWSNPASMYGTAGKPDIEGCYEGIYIAIECKTPEAYNRKGHGLSRAQEDFQSHILASGGAYFVVDGKERLKRLMVCEPCSMLHASLPDQDERIAA